MLNSRPPPVHKTPVQPLLRWLLSLFLNLRQIENQQPETTNSSLLILCLVMSTSSWTRNPQVDLQSQESNSNTFDGQNMPYILGLFPLPRMQVSHRNVYNMDFLGSRSKPSFATGKGAGAEPVAWESTTLTFRGYKGLKTFMYHCFWGPKVLLMVQQSG